MRLLALSMAIAALAAGCREPGERRWVEVARDVAGPKCQADIRCNLLSSSAAGDCERHVVAHMCWASETCSVAADDQVELEALACIERLYAIEENDRECHILWSSGAAKLVECVTTMDHPDPRWRPPE